MDIDAFKLDLEEHARRLYAWLYGSGIEYKKLYDTYDRDYYTLAYLSSGASVSELAKRLLGQIEIPNMAGQVAFMASELADGYKNVRDKMKGASTASEAAEIFMKDYEKPATSTATERQQAAENAVKMIEACTGVVLRSYSFFILRKNVFLPIYICIYLGTCLFSI